MLREAVLHEAILHEVRLHPDICIIRKYVRVWRRFRIPARAPSELPSLVGRIQGRIGQRNIGKLWTEPLLVDW